MRLASPILITILSLLNGNLIICIRSVKFVRISLIGLQEESITVESVGRLYVTCVRLGRTMSMDIKIRKFAYALCVIQKIYNRKEGFKEQRKTWF